MKPKLLIVDDDEEIRTQMNWALAQDYEVSLAEDRAGAMAAFRQQRPPVVLLDLGLPPHPGTPEEGLAALSELLAQDSLAKIIIISGQAEKKNALEAIGAGAYDFLPKPVEVEVLKLLLKRSFHVASLEKEYRQLQQHLQSDTFEGMLGTSPQMQQVFNSIRKVATTDAPVLILDEPTSAIDLKTEASIIDAIRSLTNGRTTFTIAHRLTAFDHCETFLQIDDGRVSAAPARERLAPIGVGQ